MSNTKSPSEIVEPLVKDVHASFIAAHVTGLQEAQKLIGEMADELGLAGAKDENVGVSAALRVLTEKISARITAGMRMAEEMRL